MSPRKWFAIYLISLASVFAAAELCYRTMPQPGNILSLKLRQLAALQPGYVPAVVFGTSVSLGALGRELDTYPGIVNFTLVGAVNIAGFYFVLKRFLDQGGATGAVYVFFSPEILNNRLDTGDKRNYEYFQSIFNRPAEIREIRKVAPAYRFSDALSPITRRSLFWRKLTDSILRELQREREQVDPHSLSPCAPERLSRNAVITPAIVRARETARFRISPDTRFFVQRLRRLTASEGIRLVFVVEPLQESVFELQRSAPYARQLEEMLGAGDLLWSNRFMAFPAYAFVDRLHLKRDWAECYRAVIFRDILGTGGLGRR